MKDLLKGKRIFKQESNEINYLVIPANKIKQCHLFYEIVLIKKGDTLHPNKWIYYEDEFIPIEQFQYDDYDYIFPVDKWIANDLSSIAGIGESDEITSLLRIESIPENSQSAFLELIKKEAYTENSLAETVEVFTYEYDGKEHKIVLHIDYTDSDIEYEYTEDFAKSVIVNQYHYKNITLYKTEPEEGSSGNFIRNEQWFIMLSDESNQFDIIKEIYEIEDMLQFTQFVAV